MTDAKSTRLDHKKIVLFADGTGNSSSSPQKTNVWRAYKALDVTKDSNQIAFYDNGVGTSSFQPIALVGQIFGLGLAQNVKQIYGFLCRNYKTGDDIYAFGFSRGAFTMRVVVGLIASQGIIDVNQADDDAEVQRLIKAAYSKFRREAFTASLVSFFWDKIGNLWRQLWENERSYNPKLNLHYRPKNAPAAKKGDKALITFVGLWDTVDAYGLPVDELTRAWDMVIWPLTANDRDLSDRVGRACHALALDEQRLSFEPMLWNEKPGGEPIDEKRLCQVWFAGVHANVGGSYPDDSLSFVPLNWMLDEAGKSGLNFLKSERAYFCDHQNVNGPLYDNRAGLGNLYRYAPRKLDELFDETKPNLLTKVLTACCPDIVTGRRGLLARILPFLCVKGKNPNSILWKFLDWFGVKGLQFNRVEISNPKIHHSVFDRIDNGCSSYAPINLPADYVVVNKDGGIESGKNIEVAKPKTIENLPAARHARQQYVWNKVWARKVLYYVTFILIIIFVIYPYLFDGLLQSDAPTSKVQMVAGTLLGWWQGFLSLLESIFGGLGNILKLIPTYIGKIPGLGFTEGWAAKYSNHSIAFVVFVILIGGLLFISNSLKIKLNSEMNSIWQSIFSKGTLPDGEVSKRRKRRAEFIKGPSNKFVERFLSRSIELAAVVALFTLLFFSLINHIVLTGLDGVGLICEKPAEPKIVNKESNGVFVFNSNETCYNSNLMLLKDHHYKLTFKIPGGTIVGPKGNVPDKWRDGKEGTPIITDVNGWLSAPWYYYLATPYRRHWFANWYQPIARINNTGYNIFPMKENEAINADPNSIVMTLKVKRSGVLYLYLNDAVLFTPSFVKEFYSNNYGIADVTVTDITPP